MSRHDTDWTALIAGLTFGLISVAYLVGDLSHRSLQVSWILPILLVGLGVAGATGITLRGIRQGHRQAGASGPAEPVDPDAGD